MPTLDGATLRQMLNKVAKFLLIMSTMTSAASCKATEIALKIECEAYGDAVVATNTGELIIEQRLVKYQGL